MIIMLFTGYRVRGWGSDKGDVGGREGRFRGGLDRWVSFDGRLRVVL
jgi:hypothetical protein